MSRSYLLSLAATTLALVLVAFVPMWLAPQSFIVAMPLLPLYFAALAALQHLLITRAMARSPKTFVQVFLGSTIGVLFIHLVVLALFLMSRPLEGRRFLIAFCIGYALYLVFETVALVRFVDREKKRRLQ